MGRPGTARTNTEGALEQRGVPMGALSCARPPAAWRSAGRSSRLTSAAVVVVLHAALVVVLLQFESVRTAVTAAVPVMATLISPPREKPEVLPKPPPPKPQVQRKPRPAPQPPVITAQPEAPSTYTAPPPTPVPTPPVEVAPVAPVAAAPAAEAATAPMIAPSFNAAYLNNPAPVYPAISRSMGEEGRVVLRVFVNERGQPGEVQVRTSSGFSRLDEAAQDTVRRWKFVPAKRGDTAVGAWVLVPISFSLRS